MCLNQQRPQLQLQPQQRQLQQPQPQQQKTQRLHLVLKAPTTMLNLHWECWLLQLYLSPLFSCTIHFSARWSRLQLWCLWFQSRRSLKSQLLYSGSILGVIKKNFFSKNLFEFVFNPNQFSCWRHELCCNSNYSMHSNRLHIIVGALHFICNQIMPK